MTGVLLERPISNYATPLRIAKSAMCRDGRVVGNDDFHEWYAVQSRNVHQDVDRIPLDEMPGWYSDPESGNIRHVSGKFFSVEGMDVQVENAPVSEWEQPIINQPEVGILGIIAKEFDGVLHFLMQAKIEPGNCNGLQLSPTVQATRSNFTRVHQGKEVPYLRYFRDRSHSHFLVDVRQSEQGAWFLRKRNRNMIVEVTEDLPLLEGFCWLSLGQLHRLLAVDDLVNMDARTVLACLPFAHESVVPWTPVLPDFHTTLANSCNSAAGELHTTDSILSWVSEMRSESGVSIRSVPLRELTRWSRANGRISHETGRFFDVIGVSVAAGGREVGSWCQPMIESHGMGLVAFLVRSIDGVLHALVHARVEPGYLDSVELAPTVQCTPENYLALPAEVRPVFLDDVLDAPAEKIRFDTVLSEEGGRFYHARNRYVIVESDHVSDVDDPSFRWMPLHQVVDLLRHSHYFNVQARSLIACMHSLFAVDTS